MTQQPAFYSAAIDTVSAMKLFVHVGSNDGTAFSSSMKQVADELCPVIQFHGQQAKGTITRASDNLTITIYPDPDSASDFVPRTLVFNQVDFAQSGLMQADGPELLEGGGRAYAFRIARIISEAFCEASVIPDTNGGEHAFLVGKAPVSDATANIDNLAREVDRLCDGQASCLIAHPCLDQPGACLLIDGQGKRLQPEGEVANHIRFIGSAIHKLPNALRITQQGAAYPLPYQIYPHRFTLELQNDNSMSTTRSLIARAVLADNDQASAEFHFAVIAIDQPGEFEAEEAATLASQQLQMDWRRVMGDEAAPEISDDFTIDGTRKDGRLIVRLTMVIDPHSAERYSLTGRYDLVPE